MRGSKKLLSLKNTDLCSDLIEIWVAKRQFGIKEAVVELFTYIGSRLVDPFLLRIGADILDSIAYLLILTGIDKEMLKRIIGLLVGVLITICACVAIMYLL